MTHALALVGSLTSMLLVLAAAGLALCLLAAAGLAAHQAWMRHQSRRCAQIAGEEVRLTVEVTDSEDPDKVSKALLDAADSCREVVADPAPRAQMVEEAEGKAEFELTVCRRPEGIAPRPFFRSLYFQIYRTFRNRGIHLPGVLKQLP